MAGWNKLDEFNNDNKELMKKGKDSVFQHVSWIIYQTLF